MYRSPYHLLAVLFGRHSADRVDEAFLIREGAYHPPQEQRGEL
jgi:hypothetical protein